MNKSFSLVVLMILIVLMSQPVAAKISSGIYEIEPGALVTRVGGLIGYESTHWLTGTIELEVAADASVVRITAADLQVYGNGVTWSLPETGDLPLSELIGSLQGTSLVFTEPDTAQYQTARLTLSEDGNDLLLEGSYNEGCCDRYVYTFTTVRLLAVDPALLGIYLPGVAHIDGELGAAWRSDVILFNPNETPMKVLVRYRSDNQPPIQGRLDLDLIGKETRVIRDIVAAMVDPATEAAGSKGYLRLTVDGPTAPIIAAKTYHESSDGTFGQALVPFSRERLISAGERVFLTGLEGSASTAEGYRSNLGLLNVSATEEAEVLLVLDTTMDGPTRSATYTLAPGRFLQSNLLRDLGLGAAQGVYTVSIQVVRGGPVAAYASVINNLSQDPVLLTNGLSAAATP